MKNIAILITFLLATAGCYALGFVHAANESVSLLSVSQAQTSLLTLGFIEINDLDRVKEINSSQIEAYIESLNEVEKSKKEIWKFPLIYLDLRKTLDEDKELFEESKSKIESRFNRIKSTFGKKPNQSLESDGNISGDVR